MVDLGPVSRQEERPRKTWPTWAPESWSVENLARLTESDRRWLDRMMEKVDLPTRCIHPDDRPWWWNTTLYF